MAFHPIRFPLDVALGARGGPERATDIVTLASGREERNSRWAHSRRRYNAGYGVKSRADMQAVLAFFEERRGRFHAFLWRDGLDHSASDQVIGTGDSETVAFQLVKKYGADFDPYLRPITKPVADTVVVKVDGIVTLVEVDALTGLVTFGTAPEEGAVITASFEFDVPVRFDVDRLDIELSSFDAADAPAIPADRGARMRTLDLAFRTHIESGATTLATCWRIARRDDLVLGFTDHDAVLSFGGVDYAPAHGLDSGEATQKLGPQTDTAEVVGVLHAAAITEGDILLGRYDGALVETWRVNWRDTHVRYLVRRATIGEIVREDGVFRAELRSGQHALNQPKGRFYQSLCDASLGDARCGVDLDDPAYRSSASVIEVRDRFRLAVDGIEAFDEGWFGLGQCLWSNGARSGLADRIVNHSRVGGVDLLSFAAPVGDWVVAGDDFVATAGCDRRFATCREKFGNGLNFRGFPHIPGSDFVLRYPRPGDALDGRAVVR